MSAGIWLNTVYGQKVNWKIELCNLNNYVKLFVFLCDLGGLGVKDLTQRSQSTQRLSKDKFNYFGYKALVAENWRFELDIDRTKANEKDPREICIIGSG